jgi:hypothetical protein
MVVGRQEGKHAKVASVCVIAVRKLQLSGISGEKVMSSARLLVTFSSLLVTFVTKRGQMVHHPFLFLKIY